jgi:polyvinyl alcohol dehydrogenase (cytochrome)
MMRARTLLVSFTVLLLWLAPAAVAHAQLATLGATVQRLFEDRCFSCHGDVTRIGPNANAGARPAPSFGDIRARLSPQAVFRAIDGTGIMAVHTKGWTTDDRRRIAEYVTGKAMPLVEVLAPTEGKCAAPAPAIGDPFGAPHWNGWGVDAGNGRFQPARQAGLDAADIPKLRLKWAFGFPGVTQAYAQPVIAAGRVFVGSETGLVYALDARTGCFYWTFPAMGPVRTTIVLARSAIAKSGTVLYFGDVRSNMYAVDAQTGAMLWTQKIDEHPHGRITGSPTLVDGRLYVPVAGMTEEAQAGNPAYECCTFRGSLVAMDAASGRVYWKSYTIAETPKLRGKNAKGTQLYGPAGASIWSAPTVDPEGGAVYVGTGNGFTQPAADTTDAVLAFSLKDGTLLWKNQLTEGDAVGVGADVDIGASLILRRLEDGRRVLVVGQKTGDVYGLDPDNKGAQLWKVSLSKGGMMGGVEWGMAADDRLVFVPISDHPLFSFNKPPTPEAGSLVALRLESGEQVWMQRGVATCNRPVAECHPAKAAAITATPDAVFAGSLDGYVRAYGTSDGRLLWEYNTAVPFKTVNGVEATGGSISGAGPAIAGGMLFVNSGYSFFSKGGNVLLAFGLE